MNQIRDLSREPAVPLLRRLKLVSTRFRAAAPTETQMRSFLELILIATAILTMALV